MALPRELIKLSKLCNLCDFSKLSSAGTIGNVYFTISVRTAKHWHPKFKWLRSKKIIPVVLPHTEEAKRMHKNSLKDMKIFPRYWKTRPLTITSASEVFDPYEPPQGDGKASSVLSGVYNKLSTSTKNKISDASAIRKIKSYEPDFSTDIFLQHAHDIYVKAHTVLMEKDPDKLSEYVTEMANTEMMAGLKNNTLRWKFIESLEPPKLVQSRVSEVLIKKNLFAQLTVRFHTKQSLAVYDRFGRLMYGSEILAKDVLEYIVFEKHINNEYGQWRLHAKIIPEWHENPTSFPRTYKISEEVEEEEDEDYVLIEEDYHPEPEQGTALEVSKAEAKS